MPNPTTGKVFIVGAGPGDPGLLTLRGQACLAQADVVVYDTLVNPELLVHAPQAEHVFAGKRDRRHSLPQEDINRILSVPGVDLSQDLIDHLFHGYCFFVPTWMLE